MHRVAAFACLGFAIGCGDNLVGPPLAASGDVIVVAHQDDDLLFMQPDLLERVTGHEPTTIVYVTAGDASSGLPYAEARIEGSKASYSVVAGEPDWDCGWIEIARHDALHCRLANANLSLVFLGYPDGGVSGEVSTSLLHLWEGTIHEAETVAEHRATYDRDGLIATVAAILDATHPQTIRTLEISATHSDDHSDHMFVGSLTMLAALQIGSTADLLSYRGYNINYEAVTTPDALFEQTSLPMRAYEACVTACGGVCGVTPCPTLDDPRYSNFAHRRYAVAMRRPPVGGILHSTGGCLVDDGGALALGACDAAIPVELQPGGLVALGGGCLEIAPSGAPAIGACELAPNRAFAFDDEGHLWSGLAPVPQPNMDLMHNLCLVGDADGLRLDVCGATRDARWDLVTTPTVTPRHVQTTTASTGRAIRLADMTGDGLADMCAASPNGLICAPGNGRGGFGAMIRIGSPAFVVQPQSLALGDVDGDGLADACGRDANGITCETSLSGYQAQHWASTFASAGPASPSDRSLAIVQGSVCGSTDDDVRCVRDDVESILTTLPATTGAPLWPADLDSDDQPDWCTATAGGVQCGIAAEQTITDDGVSWGFSNNDEVESSVATDGALDDTTHAAIADISGDGRGDMCVAIGDEVECAVSQSHGFGPRRLALVMPTGNPIIGLWLGDLDGDGKADPCADDGTEIACSLSP